MGLAQSATKVFAKIRLIDVLLLLLLVSAACGLTYWYISQEQYSYFWDYSRYSQQISGLISKLQKSPLEGIFSVLLSFFDDYTQLPLLLLLPIRALAGDSRFGFILSIVLVYGISFSLVMGAVVARLVHSNRRFAFWSAAFMALLVPSTWVPMLRGFPDLGGSTLLLLAVLVYWQDFSLEQKSQRRWIAFLLALSVLFRRYFVYGVRTFLLTAVWMSAAYLIRQSPLRPWVQSLKTALLRIGQTTIVFILFAFIVFLKALLINYRALYASYEASTLANLEYYIQSFGGLLLGLSAVGFGIASLSRKVSQPRLRFLGVWGLLCGLQWIFFARQISVQYTTNFVLFIVCGLSLLSWSVVQHWRPPFWAALLALLATLLNNMAFSLSQGWLQGLSPLVSLSERLALLSRREAPLYREDYAEIVALVNELRQKSHADLPIYVAASSYTLNSSVLEVAEQQIRSQKTLPLVKPANIDSRDFYPLNGLMRSHFVVVATPTQYHVDPQEQKLVGSVVAAFQEHKAIGTDFRPLPVRFNLEKGVSVSIYERIRPTSIQTVLQTISFFKHQVIRQPARESYWLTLSSQPVDIEKEPLIRQVFISRLPLMDRLPTSLLYFGSLPPSGQVTGYLSLSKCQNAQQPIQLTLSALNQDGAVLSQQRVAYVNPQYQFFRLNFSARATAFLRLDLETPSSAIPGCRAELAFLQVSK